MTRQLKARPTEYKGVVYRSRSEAMFARWLELDVAERELDGFCYEPQDFEVGGWVPDFMCWRVQKRNNKLSIDPVFIEYKPEIPTGTYLAELAGKAEKLWELSCEQPLFTTFALSIVCGGFFSNRQAIFNANRVEGKIKFIDKGRWLDDKDKIRILNTRFDLEFRYGG
jgi:hypothetical protein